MLFDKANRTIWQSFDHPTDCLLPGQNLVSRQKLTASVSAYNLSQGLLSLSVLNGGTGTYIDSDPPQFYYTAKYDYDSYYSFDGHTLTAFPDTDISAQFMKLESDGHLRVYIWDVNRYKWKDPLEIWSPFVGNCGYPMVCGRYSICANNGQCDCPVEGNFFRPSIGRNGHLGCTDIHFLRFFAVQNSSMAQNQLAINSGGKNSRPFKVIIGSTLAASLGIILGITTCFILFKRRSQSRKNGDLLDLEPILPGILFRFSYNELKIFTENFSRKLGEGGFGSVYEGTLSNGNKIAVKHMDGVGQVKESFLTEVKTVGGIHHINLVKLIGYWAEKSHWLLIYEYMVNGSLDRWISHEKQENELTWLTRQRIISDIAKRLAYLHDECSQKIIWISNHKTSF
ncbi:hypothetical protein KY285_031336 [Solanum tuberosum]|nr:hypothetical protein KY284_031129 [Solanum tuberosum]KAH0656454.1 hypothetical protein KY285_031336 [Solanum tuberosum]